MRNVVLETHRRDEVELVASYLPDNDHTPFATHMRRVDEPESLFWGHYLRDLRELADDVERRLGRGS